VFSTKEELNSFIQKGLRRSEPGPCQREPYEQNGRFIPEGKITPVKEKATHIRGLQIGRRVHKARSD